MKQLFLTLALAMASGVVARGAFLLNESFSYPDGALVGAAGSPWAAHFSPGDGAVQVISGQIRLTGAGSEDVNAPLAGAPYTATSAAVLYSSFKVKVTSSAGFNGAYFAHFKDTNTGPATGYGARIWISRTNTIDGGPLPSGKFRFGIGNGAASTNSSGQIGTDLSLNTTNVLVTKFVPATGIATIWLNPAAESDPSVTATDPGRVDRPNPIDVVAYAFRQETGEGAMLIDDLRVGTNFNDVAGPNHSPSISSIDPQATAAGVATAAILFTIGDDETAATGLILSGSSSNPSLVTSNHIVFGGSGSNRTVTVTPQPGQQGYATITLTVSDPDGGAALVSFQLAVGVPTVSVIPNQITPTNTGLGPVSFTVGDTETPAGGLTVTATSGNPSLLPNGGITLGGNGATRTISFLPAANQAGLATVTLVVSDGTSSSSNSFILTVYSLLGLLRSDDFNRGDGSLVTGDGQWLSNGGTGGTNFGQTQILGHQLQVTGTQSEDCSTELPPGQFATPTYAPASGTVFFLSLKMNYQALPKASGDYFAHFRDGNNGFRGRIYASTTGAAAGRYRIGVANAASAASSATFIPTDLATNQSFTIVLRYNGGTSESRLWLEPGSETSLGYDATDPAQPVTIQVFTFRQNPEVGTVLVDDLKIGSSFADVLPAPAVPSLRLTRSGGSVELSWPSSYTGYQLQGNNALLPASWADVTNTPSPVGASNVVSLGMTPGKRFFRLVK